MRASNALLILFCLSSVSPAHAWKWDDASTQWRPQKDYQEAVDSYRLKVAKGTLADFERIRALRDIISTYKPLDVDTTMLEKEMTVLLNEKHLQLPDLKSSSKDDPFLYVVKKGDTLAIISQKIYGNKDQDKLLYLANKGILENPYTLYSGQKLIVPWKSTESRPTSYKVKSGDTLELIAVHIYGDKSLWRQIYQVNQSKLKNSYTLYAGQELTLPDIKQKSGIPGEYTIKRGDTLPSIAFKLYGDKSLWKRIYEVNRERCKTPDVLIVGQVLEIPPLDQVISVKKAQKSAPVEQKAVISEAENEGHEMPVKASGEEDVSQPLTDVKYDNQESSYTVESKSQETLAQDVPEKTTKEKSDSNGSTGEKFYTVVKGDDLPSISIRLYGIRSNWRKIYLANKELIGSNPDVIHVGQKLVIP